MGNIEGACETCGLGPRSCPGHMGSIPLPFPVFNGLLTEESLKLI